MWRTKWKIEESSNQILPERDRMSFRQDLSERGFAALSGPVYQNWQILPKTIKWFLVRMIKSYRVRCWDIDLEMF